MKVLITAGGTKEPIDPVRYIGNSSSGKMGRALAVVAEDEYKAEVVLLDAAEGSAADLYNKVFEHYKTADIVIMAAAVADYTPILKEPNKIKKGNQNITIELEPTTDILAELGKKKQKQYLVGFCLESDHLLAEAQRKLKAKNLDMIIANGVETIGSEQSRAVILTKDQQIDLPKMSKEELAETILDLIMEYK
ncbi:MAG: phosphopantothenoylcysteine decarboxylase [Candidatus Margulisiibacteriota bacterium]